MVNNEILFMGEAEELLQDVFAIICLPSSQSVFKQIALRFCKFRLSLSVYVYFEPQYSPSAYKKHATDEFAILSLTRTSLKTPLKNNALYT